MRLHHMARELAKCIDVRDVGCPLTWVRTRIALDQLAVGNDLVVVHAEMKKMNELMDAAVLAAR